MTTSPTPPLPQSTNLPPPNPYVGPRTFSAAQRHLFFGREREARDLLARVLSERLLLFYAQSGAGKSSLLHARLIPLLQEEKGFVVLPVGRVSGELPAGVAQVDNIFVYNLLLSIDEGSEPGLLAQVSLGDFLARLARRTVASEGEEERKGWVYDPDLAPTPAGAAPSARRYAVLVDQFEEIITGHPGRWREREDFFRQLDAALAADRNLWVVLTLREDYVAALDPYAELCFNRLRARFYMERMAKAAALEAVRQPAELAGRPFAPGVAEQLVDNLRQVRLPGREETVAGQYVEPVQLQVVCWQLWQNLAARAPLALPGRGAGGEGGTEITLEDLAVAGDVNQALTAFYEETVAAALADPAAAGTNERQVRTWFDEKLITEAATRGLVHQGERESGGLPNAVVGALQRRFLVRGEARGGDVWIELVHDRFVKPIRASNAAWFPQHLSALQRQAALWESQKRPDQLLLCGKELDEAEAWAATREADVEEVERNFLTACRAEREAVRERHHQAKRLRRWQRAIAAIILCSVILAALSAYYLYFNQAARLEAARQASSRELAAQSASQLDNQYDLALLLSLEANRIATTVEAHGSLLSAVEHTPELVQFARDPSDQVSAVAFSPDGRLMATAGRTSTDEDEANASGGIVSLWDVGAGGVQLKTSLGVLSWPALAAAFSPAGDTLAVGCEDGTLHLWDLRNPSPTALTWAAHGDRVNSLAFSSDGRWLASAGKRDVLLWDLAAPGPPDRSPFLSGEEVYSLAFAPLDYTLAVGYVDGRVRLWDVAARQASELAGPGWHQQTNSLAFSPDGQRLALARLDGAVIVWDVTSNETMTLTGHTDSVETVAFNSDGTLLASAGRDRRVRVWNMAFIQRGCVQQPRLAFDAHDDWVMGVAFHPDGRRLASAGHDGNVIMWDTAARTRLGRTLEGLHDDEVWAVAISPDGRQAASAGKDHRVVLWDLATGQPTELGRHDGPGRAVAFSPDGAMVASGGHDGYVQRWDISGSQPVELDPLIHATAEWVSSVAFSPDGQFLASSGFDKTIKLWNLRTIPPVSRTLTGHSGEVWSVAFSSDGTRLASGDDAGQIILWDVAQGKAQGQTLSGPASVLSVAFSPDGKRLASGDGDRRVIIWDVSERIPIVRLVGQAGKVSGVTFSPDGLTLASSSHDGSIVLWDVQGERLIGQMRGHTAPVNALAFSQDGRLLADASDDHTLMIWDVAFDSWQAHACHIAGRNLTLEEWQQYLGAQPYQRTCPDLPGPDAITQKPTNARNNTAEEKP